MWSFNSIISPLCGPKSSHCLSKMKLLNQCCCWMWLCCERTICSTVKGQTKPFFPCHLSSRLYFPSCFCFNGEAPPVCNGCWINQTLAPFSVSDEQPEGSGAEWGLISTLSTIHPLHIDLIQLHSVVSLSINHCYSQVNTTGASIK